MVELALIRRCKRQRGCLVSLPTLPKQDAIGSNPIIHSNTDTNHNRFVPKPLWLYSQGMPNLNCPPLACYAGCTETYDLLNWLKYVGR